MFRCTPVVVSTGWHYSYSNADRVSSLWRRRHPNPREKGSSRAGRQGQWTLLHYLHPPLPPLPPPTFPSFVCVLICLALLEKAWSKHMNVKTTTTTTTPLFIRTNQNVPIFGVVPFINLLKTTFEQELNGENWDIELGQLSAFEWAMPFWKTTYFHWKFEHVLFCLTLLKLIFTFI